MSCLAASITALASPTAHSVEARALAASVVNDEPIGDQSDPDPVPGLAEGSRGAVERVGGVDEDVCARG
jgi:hypothetical protein